MEQRKMAGGRGCVGENTCHQTIYECVKLQRTKMGEIVHCDASMQGV